jgi:RNA recognition motif-containing protein
MNIYVANLSFHTTEDDLHSMFSQYGKVESVKIILDKETNKSRGFGFIEMQDEQAGQEAIKMLNNKDIQGRLLSVTIARPKENKGFQNRKRW